MTREEAKNYLLSEFVNMNSSYDYFEIKDMYEMSIDVIYNSFEQRIKEYEFEMECYRQCEHQLGLCETALEEAEQRIKELEEANARFKPKIVKLNQDIADRDLFIRSLEKQLSSIKDCNRKLIELIQTANSDLEAQEIMIDDYKKRIEELEQQLEPRSCEWCKHDGGKFGCQMFYSCVRVATRKGMPDRYEPNKDKE